MGTVPESVGRLKASVEAACGRVFGIFDFAGGNHSIGENAGEVHLLVLGDPQFGVQALSADRMVALDLPGMVLVDNTAAGSATANVQPAEMLAEWNIPADAPVLGVMSRTLEAVTSAAAR